MIPHEPSDLSSMTTERPPRRGRRARLLLAALAATSTFSVVGSTPTAGAVADSDWLGIVNTYRQMSGLDPVTANATWSSQAAAHSCYMLYNGIAHDEIPGRQGYTEGGDIAGNSGNVAVSSAVTATARNHIDLWMTGPFHAIGVLRHNLTSSGFGMCALQNTPTGWRSGGTLDVIRGIDPSRPRPSTPIVFPGNGSTIPLNAFITEYPDPVSLCGWSGTAGLPLIAMMPSDVGSATSTLVGPNGPVQTCSLHQNNTGSNATAQAILDADNAVVVVPRTVLADGTYTATVSTNVGTASWSFTIDADGPLAYVPPSTQPTADPGRFEAVAPFRLVDTREPGALTRLRARQIARIRVGDSGITAVSANFTAVNPSGGGYVTAYDCTPTLPVASTLNTIPGRDVANQSIVPLDNGYLCVYSSVDTDLIVDVNGYFRLANSPAAQTSDRFTPIAPVRVADTRDAGVNRIVGDAAPRPFQIVGAVPGIPADASAVALNVTVTGTTGPGWLLASDCAPSQSSSINYLTSEDRPNSAIVPLDPSGRICITSFRSTDVVIDITGFFSPNGQVDFVPLSPLRLLDTREPGGVLNPFTGGGRLGTNRTIEIPIRGQRGVPSNATAVSVNVTAVDAVSGTYLTAYPCGTRPPTSTLNLSPAQGVAANGTMVKLSSTGKLCLYTLQSVHAIVDINGVYL
ncbi:MAG: hypothetical protein RLZZ01_580 [Actinomycetota bacterium]